MPNDVGLQVEYQRLIATPHVRKRLSPTPREVERLVNDEVAAAAKEGRNVDAGFVDRIRTIASSSGLDSLNRILAEMVDSLDEALKRATKKIQVPVFVGAYPTGKLNAVAQAIPGGVLILINTGLMMLVHQAVKVMLLTWDIQVGEENFPAPFTEDDAVDALAEIALAYINAGHSTAAARIPTSSATVRARVTQDIVSECERFAIAHEYGHVLADHLTDAATVPYATPVGDLDVIDESQLDEFEADLIGTMLIVQRVGYEIDSEEKFHRLVHSAAAPLIFFALCDLISAVEEELWGPPDKESGHPPASQRLAACREVLISLKLNAILEAATPLSDFFIERKSRVIEAARRMDLG